MPESTGKTERISLRVDKHVKKSLEHASTILGTSVTDLVVQASMMRALKVIEQRNAVTLSDRDRDAFLELIKNDTPNDALREASEARKNLIE